MRQVCLHCLWGKSGNTYEIATFAVRLRMRDAWGLNFRLIQIKHTEKGKREINAENIEEFATFISRRKGDFLI